MKEIRKKQKKMFTAMKIIVAVTLIYIVVYIAAVLFSYLSDGLILASLVIALVYYSKYGKTNAFLNRIEHEIKDCGYYKTDGLPSDPEKYMESLFEKLKSNGYAVDSNVEYDGLEFSYTAFKEKSFSMCAESMI